MIHFTWHRLTCPRCRKRTYVLLDPDERTVDCRECCTLSREGLNGRLVECEQELGEELDEMNVS